MAEELKVESKVRDRVIVLSIGYGAELIFAEKARERVRDALREHYRSKLGDEKQKQQGQEDKVITSSCVVVITADTAGSPLVRALFDLWEEVTRGGRGPGQLICASYPDDYIVSLTALGLPTLPGFRLAKDEEEAIKILTKP